MKDDCLVDSVGGAKYPLAVGTKNANACTVQSFSLAPLF